MIKKGRKIIGNEQYILYSDSTSQRFNIGKTKNLSQNVDLKDIEDFVFPSMVSDEDKVREEYDKY